MTYDVVLTGVLVLGVIAVTVARDRANHRRWLARIEAERGPDARAVIEAEWAATRWDRRPLRWIRRWAP